MHHGMTFNFGCAKQCSPAIFETCFSYDKDIGIAATDYYMSVIWASLMLFCELLMHNLFYCRCFYLLGTFL